MGGKLYQWEEFIDNNTPKKDISKWESNFGPKILTRNNTLKVKFTVLIDNPGTQVYIIGDFNNWKKSEEYKLQHDENSVTAYIILDQLKHKAKYKFVTILNGHQHTLADPAAVYFDEEGNSVLWDFEQEYKQKHGFVNTIERSTKIMQTDLPGMIAQWADKKGNLGYKIPEKEYYKFITNSGILEEIKRLGFNTIQFLPFAKTIDGKNWKFRYLVPFHFSVQTDWGDPSEFAEMIDKCHELDIAVIGDFVLGHLPSKDFSVFGRGSSQVGIHHWIGRHGTRVFMKEETAWGTMRVDFDNPYIREFFISSCLHFLKQYKIDGLRIDNVDGIIRYGPNGDEEERPNGRYFLRELNQTIYDYNPNALIHFESHYFHEDNAKMLVTPFALDKRSLGATAYNSSRMTYYFHREIMLRSATKISPWKFRDITEEKEWGQSNSTIADFHNHDAAAGLMAERATGSYAYDTMTCKQPENHVHALGKIKIMEAIIAFGCEGRTLDLVQSFLLQSGTFEHDTSIHWPLTFNQVNHNTLEYKKKVNDIMDDPAFWPMHTKNRKFLNVDEKNKILVIERSADYKGKKSKFTIVINLSSWKHYNYKVGLTGKKDQEVILNSDLFDYAGFGLISLPKILKNNPSTSFEVLDREVDLSTVAPYHVVVLKEV